MTARLRIVDDHELLAFSVACALQARGLDVAPMPVTAPDVLIEAVLTDAPDVVLLDLDLGGAIGSGSTLVRPLAAAGIRVLIVTGSTDRLEIAAALEAGAVGYVCKSEPFDVLIDIAEGAAAGRSVLPDPVRHELLTELRHARAAARADRERFDRLTPRERDVLHALCDGQSVGAIAASWFVSVPTVRTQVRAILQKLEVGSQLEAVAQAHRSGWHTAGCRSA
jgi:DNA-binding NarL/FixJ family response regulator